MTNSLGSLLTDRNYNEPPEIHTIKKFVHDEIGFTPRVTISPNSFIIIVPSASAAGALRIRLLDLKKQLSTKNRILIRIG